MTNTLPTGRFMLVELEPNVPALRWNAFMGHVRDWPGVVSVSDLAFMDKELLEAMLKRPEKPSVTVPERVVQGELLG